MEALLVAIFSNPIQVLLTSLQLVCGLCVLFLHGRSVGTQRCSGVLLREALDKRLYFHAILWLQYIVKS